MSRLTRIVSIDGPDLSEARRRKVELSLVRTSQPLVSDADYDTLMQLMAETQARYPNQSLPEGTPDMYLAEWERMAARYGIHEFRDSLACLLQDLERPRFFPDPLEIEDRIREKRRAKCDRQRALDEMEKLDKMRAQWKRERAGDRLVAEGRKSEGTVTQQKCG